MVDFKIIAEIVDRAAKMELLACDKMSLIMDLECATEEFNLRLNDLLKADSYNFSHDIVGIQNNINRKKRKMDNFFIPRFAR